MDADPLITVQLYDVIPAGAAYEFDDLGQTVVCPEIEQGTGQFCATPLKKESINKFKSTTKVEMNLKPFLNHNRFLLKFEFVLLLSGTL